MFDSWFLSSGMWNIHQCAIIGWFMNETASSLDNFSLFYMPIIVQENYKDISTDKCRWFLILKVSVIFWEFTESIILMIWMRHGINSENLHSKWKGELRSKRAVAVTGKVTCPSCVWFAVTGNSGPGGRSTNRSLCHVVCKGSWPQILPSCSNLYMFAVGLTTLEKVKNFTSFPVVQDWLKPPK